MRFVAQLAKFVSLALLNSATGAAPSYEINLNDNPHELFWRKKYNLVSFYSNNDESKAVDALVQQAKTLVESQIEQGSMGARSVGWYRVNADEMPDFALDEPGGSQQLMISFKYDIERFINFAKGPGKSD